jgi:hypothetical protein
MLLYIFQHDLYVIQYPCVSNIYIAFMDTSKIKMVVTHAFAKVSLYIPVVYRVYKNNESQ